MEKYTIHTVEHESNLFYCVYELATEQVYDFFLFEEDAIKCKEKLDRGHSFDGFTPSFMLKKIVVVSDLNSKFNEL